MLTGCVAVLFEVTTCLLAQPCVLMETSAMLSPGPIRQCPFCFPHSCVHVCCIHLCLLDFCCLRCWPADCAEAPRHAGSLCDVFILLPPCAQSWYSVGALKIWHAACHLWLSVAVQSKSAALQMDDESNVPDLHVPEGVFIASIDDGG